MTTTPAASLPAAPATTPTAGLPVVPAASPSDGAPAAPRAELPIVDLLARAGAAVAGERRRRAAATGTSATALAVLRVLTTDDGLAQRELAALAGVAPATLTPVLDELTASGDVVRTRDPDDRRVQRVLLTPGGRARWSAVSGVCAPVLPDPPDGHVRAVREYLLAVIDLLEQDR